MKYKFNIADALQAFGGLLATIFIGVIFFTIFGSRNINLLIVLSAIMAIAGAFALNRYKGAFFNSLFFGLTLMGELILIFSITARFFSKKYYMFSFGGSDAIYFITIAIFALSYSLVKSQLHRVVASIAIIYSIFTLALNNGYYTLAIALFTILVTYLLLKEKHTEFGYILGVMLLFSTFFGHHYIVNIKNFHPLLNMHYIYTLSIAISLVYFLKYLKFKESEPFFWLILIAFTALSYIEPIVVALNLLIYFIAKAKDNKGLQIATIASFVLNVVAYNFAEHITFLQKSRELAIYGILTLIVALFLLLAKRRLQND